jgi:hypothetical protein
MVEPAFETVKTVQAKDDDAATDKKKTSSPKSLAKKAKKSGSEAKATTTVESMIPKIAERIEEGVPPQEAAKEAIMEMSDSKESTQSE